MAAKVLLGFILSALAFGQEIRFNRVEPDVLERRLARVSSDNRTRGQILRQMFTEAGCPSEQIEEPKVSGSKLPNVICRLPGESPDAVAVGAHYDKVAQGRGAVDNWTGVVLLPTLYQSLNGWPRKLTFIFAGFADEEKGLVGSRSFEKT